MFHPASQGPIDSSDELATLQFFIDLQQHHASSRLQGRSFRRFSPGCGSKRKEMEVAEISIRYGTGVNINHSRTYIQ